MLYGNKALIAARGNNLGFAPDAMFIINMYKQLMLHPLDHQLTKP